MKHLDEYRAEQGVAPLVEAIRAVVTQPWRIMEICGGQTHSIVRFGLDSLMPAGVEFIHGPGCPVCVTPVELVDRAVAIASRSDVIFCSFGDMLRVPGSRLDLLAVRSRGGDIRIVYSPLDCIRIAKDNPDKQVVFFAIGFETTAPVNAMSVLEAQRQSLSNYSILVSQFRVPPALEAVLGSPQRRVDGVLAAGHVCAVMGMEEYLPIAERHRTPMVIAGFEPLDLLRAILKLVRQLEAGRCHVESAYERIARDAGNPRARAIIREVFEITDRVWRGMGSIPHSGLGLRSGFESFDAARRFQVETLEAHEDAQCCSGQVLQGLMKPIDCPAFRSRCTPDQPLGATMVSHEGACAAYYRFRGSSDSAVMG